VVSAASSVTDANLFQQVGSQFSQAAPNYSHYARLQRHAAGRLIQLLPSFCDSLLDLGAGPGWYLDQLAARCNQLIAMDLSVGMLQQIRQPKACAVVANAQMLPIQQASLDATFSSLMLQWCPKPDQVLWQLAQALKPGGVAVLSTLLEGTLIELQQSWAQLDTYQHINSFLPLTYFTALQCQFRRLGVELELDTELVQLPYPNVRELARELKGLGASTVVSHKRPGLTGKGYWQHLEQHYPKTQAGIMASYHLLYIRIWRRS